MWLPTFFQTFDAGPLQPTTYYPQGIELKHNQDTSSEGSDARAAIQRAVFLGLGVLLLAVALLLLLLSSGGREGQVEEQVEDDPGKKQILKQDRVEQMALPSGPTCGEKALGSIGAGMCCYNWNCF